MSEWPFPSLTVEEMEKIEESREFWEDPETLFRNKVNSLPDAPEKWQILFINVFFALNYSISGESS